MREREPQYPPEYDEPEALECPCGRPNVKDDEETPLYDPDPAFCCEGCYRRYGTDDGAYALVDFDNPAAYVGGEEGVYVGVGEGPDGWYVSTIVDCNAYCGEMTTDDGPYPSEAEATKAGTYGAADWCLENEIEFDLDELTCCEDAKE